MHVRVLQVTALVAFFCASARAAPLQIPTNVPIVEVAQQTNTYTFVPVNENNSTIKRVVPIADALVTGQSVSDVEAKVSSTRRLPIGTGANVTASVKFPKAAIAKALVASAKLAGAVALPTVASVALDALLDFGLKNVRVDEGGKLVADSEDQAIYVVSRGSSYMDASGSWIYDFAAACKSFRADYFPHATWDGMCSFPGGEIAHGLQIKNTADKCPAGWYVQGTTKCSKDRPLTPMTEQSVLDWIAARDGWPTSASVALAGMLQYPDTRRILQDYPSNGVEILGPSSVPGKSTTATESVQLVPGTNTVAAPGTTTATQPGTKTTTTTATHPITYSGNTVSHSTVNNTTTNITNNVTNVTTNETKTEEVKDDKQPDQCQKYPNTIGCKEFDFDTPDGEIPKKQIDVSWSPVDLGLGGGACPAPVQIGPDKQFSYQATCDNLGLIKPMVLAIAFFVGGMIIFGGRVEQ
jgi:hypothetical protein